MTASMGLLAKRPRRLDTPLPGETLLGHVNRVVKCFHLLFGTAPFRTHLAEVWLRYFKIKDEDAPLFFANALVASCLHDLGKANGDFQDAVRGKLARQGIRHEHLTGIVLWLPPVQEWVKTIPGVDVKIVISAVVAHHLKADQSQFGVFAPDRYRILLYPEGIYEIIRITAKAAGRRLPEDLCLGRDWTKGFTRRLADDLSKVLRRFARELRHNDRANRLLQAVRSALIIADSAASGLVREEKDLGVWLRTAFSQDRLLTGRDIDNEVIRPRVADLRSKGVRFVWNDFQDATERLSVRVLLLASCGSGKTLAAWRWIKGQLARRAVARVIFLYPTRATATEGFRDYVSWAPEADAALIHGTSGYELEGMFENPQDDRFGKDFTTDDRLFAIGYWQRRIFSATVDQFLGFMQHSYRSTCLLPLLADSVVVIDEVHSFDRNLFSALKRFLKEFAVPVLCMTASLPLRRQEDLVECGLQLFPSDARQSGDLRDIAEAERYRVERIGDSEIARQIALAALDQKRRVLWVLNTVDRCQRLAQELGATCYHSRYKLEDRAERHREAIDAFHVKHRSALVVATQVCEMSLDLDADVLVTEQAPVTALIQRMGRCNRQSRPQRGKLGEVFVYPAVDTKPYSEADLQGAEAFLGALDKTEVSQARLQELLEEFGPEGVEVDRYAAFVETGAWAVSREVGLREAGDFTVPAILDNDVERYRKLRRERSPTDGLILPAPCYLATRDSRLGDYPAVVPSSHYDRRYGLFNHPLEEER